MAALAKTKLLYQQQGNLHQHEATITGFEPIPVEAGNDKADEQESHAIYLDETIFHVQGGGQPFDVGNIESATGSFIVTSVRNADGETVRHAGRFASVDKSNFSAGDKVQMSIDVDRRLLNSRIHSAGHILGVAIMRLSREGKLPELVETKAKHYPGDACVEFKGLIEGKAKDMIQAASDELVGEARPLTICFWSRVECAEHNVALPEKIEGDIFRAVDIEGCGAYACGGTHVTDTKGVGKINVRSIKRQKGTSRVSYSVS
ncbi:uncharacterized protein HMPREF1541_04213 [Cyphellophora europaea CBS 101466]|uniref:Threonyl/alanyl tRNA synthetase SAD domain-containing protein n=1 Tax=Cyphellophora europaea (strain CBS 101466) TaxID=1220924 RepID=W2S0R8_CYPE1|nr:uncharacterized protein HMPREF1541_04213 [Cyphellophora europaea CBS 101466]ETN42272.1 hypothetical protein HMPREF1541_04213 [Cyphellophora europaea CBS 101466]